MQTKPPTGPTMVNLFNSQKNGWLEECRDVAKRLLRTMDTITIEDVTAIVPRPTYLHRNVTGSVFNKEFRPVGFTVAKHKEANGRVIRQWRLR